MGDATILKQWAVQLPQEVAARLSETARQTEQSEAEVVARALEGFLLFDVEQTEKIVEGIEDAKAGRFATDEQVEAIFSKWQQRL